jgi:hypothetical protein
MDFSLIFYDDFYNIKAAYFVNDKINKKSSLIFFLSIPVHAIYVSVFAKKELSKTQLFQSTVVTLVPLSYLSDN